MIEIRDAQAMRRAIDTAVDMELRDLLTRRFDQLGFVEGYDLGELAHFLILQPEDTMEALDAALGFSLLINFVDGTPYGDPAFVPSAEWISDHGGWYEMAYVLTDDGFGWIVFVPKVERMDARLLSMCADNALPQGDCSDGIRH